MEKTRWTRVGPRESDVADVLGTAGCGLTYGQIRIGGHHGEVYSIVARDGRVYYRIPRTRRRYVRLFDLPTGQVIEVRRVVRPSWYEQFIDDVRRRAVYILRHTPPDVWPEIRLEATRAIEGLQALRDDLESGSELIDALRRAGLAPDGWNEKYRITSLQQQGAGGYQALVEDAFRRRDGFVYEWTGKYRCVAWGEPYGENSYKAGLEIRYKNSPPGHWLLLDGHRAIYWSD